MKRIHALLLAVAVAFGAAAQDAPQEPTPGVKLGDQVYGVDRLIDRQVAPGVRYVRYRVPEYPLNINVLTVDMTNPYNRVENTIANDSAIGTESLVAAAARQSREGHYAVAGANANFWVVSGGIDSPAYNGTTRNGSMHNGKIVTEANQFNDQFDYGTMSTGVIGVSVDKKVYIDRCTAEIAVANERFGVLTVHECNKGVKPNELGMYNDLYGATRAFKPVTMNWKEETGVGATEVILDLAPGETWRSATILNFDVKEVRTGAGNGTLGEHDLALVGRDYFRDALAMLQPGDRVQLRYQWTFRPDSPSEAVTPMLENLVGGNAMIMVDGEKTANNDFQEYNSMVYSRCCYGRSADRSKMFICVVDKSTDPIYGQSAGCTTSIVCDFMKALGCTDLSNCDAGGSAQMFIRDRIVNKTTESTPRAVANGMLIYSTAPEDHEVASLAFDEISLKAPVYGRFSPKVIAYNKYGYPIDYDFTDFTLSCDAGIGSCQGSTFTAGANPCRGTLTASYGGATVSAPIEVLEAEIGLRVKEIVLDGTRSYPVEVVAEIGGQTYTYDPASVQWSLSSDDVATIGADGVLRGLANGTDTLTGCIGQYTDRATVSVEIPSTATLDLGAWSEWTAKGASGINQVKLADDGTVSYSYASPREAYVQLSRDSRLYSLPDRLSVGFRSSLPVASVSMSLRAAQQSRANVLVFEAPDGGTYAAGEDAELTLSLADYFDTADLATFPMQLQYLRFTLARDASYKGEQSLKLNHLRTEYDHFEAGVALVGADAPADVQLAPAAPRCGAALAVRATGLQSVELYCLSGSVVASARASEGSAQLTAPASPGVYILVAKTTGGSAAAKIAVR